MNDYLSGPASLFSDMARGKCPVFSRGIDLASVKAHLEAANKMVADLCLGKRDWFMSIPAREDYDPDLVIGQALRDAADMLSVLKAIKENQEV